MEWKKRNANIAELEKNIIAFWFPNLKNLKEERCLESNQCVTVFNKFDMILQYLSYKNQQKQISIFHTEISFLNEEE